MITILGPTASGKTHLAVHLARHLQGEVISADSRQVYRGMDIGTGKDLSEYEIDGLCIPYHLIDIAEPGSEYNVFQFQKDFLEVYSQILERNSLPILCGGTGMYLESVLKGYRMLEVPEDKTLRSKMALKSDDELSVWLCELRSVHNTTDILDRRRLERAIEIETFQQAHREEMNDFPKIKNTIFGIRWERETLKKRITERLRARLEQGMVEEVEGLLAKGLTPEQLKFYGLEYKLITQYVKGELNRNDMFQKLNTAIHQFAKRQMTWFRKMEREGREIVWLEGEWSEEEKMKRVIRTIS
ncbi:MAG: tRNA (adenosine(37)-N6)-dimethylallyltransferase MiaA [Cytophagales bacterium]|nr:tRNA (adenosine(37)-N6)-dimethylallyltransferase MiaA [Cytophagales bacterium]